MLSNFRTFSLFEGNFSALLTKMKWSISWWVIYSYLFKRGILLLGTSTIESLKCWLLRAVDLIWRLCGILLFRYHINILGIYFLRTTSTLRRVHTIRRERTICFRSRILSYHHSRIVWLLMNLRCLREQRRSLCILLCSLVSTRTHIYRFRHLFEGYQLSYRLMRTSRCLLIVSL